MKRILLSAMLLIISVSFALAQVPQAFKYQAVARDLNGTLLSDRTVTFRVSLLAGAADGNAVYSETHNAVTNPFGLVNLDIGLGRDATGSLSQISWGAGSYYLKIEMDENGGTNFRTMGISQLLSVPYALYSGSAAGLVSPGEGQGGVPANVWSLFGNSNTNPPTDKLGTTDAKDLVMVTSDIPRLIIRADGHVDIERNLRVGEDLRVLRNVYLNTTSGSTTNYGPFTVANLSPTLLSGSLTVDHATDLNSSLNVDGVTDLNSAFHVNNVSPSIVTGTLLLNGDGTFNQHLLLDNASINSTLPSNGALQVRGGAGIGKNLNVGGNAAFDGNVTIKGPLALTDTTQSTQPTNGALTVAGGVGIVKRLNVFGMTTLTNKVFVGNQMTITANPGAGSDASFDDYPLRITGGNQGIAIKVNGSRTGANNYISFWDNAGGGKMWGRIEGQTPGELATDAEFIYDNVIFGMELIIAISNTVMAGIEVAGASSSSTVCAGLGACVTAPVPSLIVAAVAKLVIQIADLVIKVAEPIAYNAFKFSQIGVTYASGSGDYAEYLLKENPSDMFMPGEIVGVRAGRISRNTEGAERIMVISLKPIVLGNMPEAGKENLYEKVAFMGQVPVKVLGKVRSGDYILPSGYSNGLGIAIPAVRMKSQDFARVAGIAWTEGEDAQLNVVNVAVGLSTNDAAGLVAQQDAKITGLENEIREMRDQMNRTNQMLAKLVPGFEIPGGQAAAGTVPAVINQNSNSGQVTVGPAEERVVVYFEVSRDRVLEGYALAETMMREKGIDIENHPFFKKVKSEPGYFDTFINEAQASINKAIREKAAIDARSGSKVEIRSQQD